MASIRDLAADLVDVIQSQTNIVWGNTAGSTPEGTVQLDTLDETAIALANIPSGQAIAFKSSEDGKWYALAAASAAITQDRIIYRRRSGEEDTKKTYRIKQLQIEEDSENRRFNIYIGGDRPRKEKIYSHEAPDNGAPELFYFKQTGVSAAIDNLGRGKNDWIAGITIELPTYTYVPGQSPPRYDPQTSFVNYKLVIVSPKLPQPIETVLINQPMGFKYKGNGVWITPTIFGRRASEKIGIQRISSNNGQFDLVDSGRLNLWDSAINFFPDTRSGEIGNVYVEMGEVTVSKGKYERICTRTEDSYVEIKTTYSYKRQMGRNFAKETSLFGSSGESGVYMPIRFVLPEFMRYEAFRVKGFESASCKQFDLLYKGNTDAYIYTEDEVSWTKNGLEALWERYYYFAEVANTREMLNKLGKLTIVFDFREDLFPFRFGDSKNIFLGSIFYFIQLFVANSGEYIGFPPDVVAPKGKLNTKILNPQTFSHSEQHKALLTTDSGKTFDVTPVERTVTHPTIVGSKLYSVNQAIFFRADLSPSNGLLPRPGGFPKVEVDYTLLKQVVSGFSRYNWYLRINFSQFGGSTLPVPYEDSKNPNGLPMDMSKSKETFTLPNVFFTVVVPFTGPYFLSGIYIGIPKRKRKKGTATVTQVDISASGKITLKTIDDVPVIAPKINKDSKGKDLNSYVSSSSYYP